MAERKYKILPGVPMPDLKQILEASSDYTDPGELKVSISSRKERETKVVTTKDLTPEEIKHLQELGLEVAQAVDEANLESQRKMDEIKNRNVVAPVTMDNLRETAAASIEDEDKKAEVQRHLDELAKEKEKEEELKRQRMERRAKQKQAVEDLLKKKEEGADTKTNASQPSEETKVDDSQETQADDGGELNVVSDDDTMSSFSEFM